MVLLAEYMNAGKVVLAGVGALTATLLAVLLPMAAASAGVDSLSAGTQPTAEPQTAGNPASAIPRVGSA